MAARAREGSVGADLATRLVDPDAYRRGQRSLRSVSRPPTGCLDQGHGEGLDATHRAGRHGVAPRDRPLPRLIAAPHQDRPVGFSADDLRRIGTVIAVVSEAEKPRAILGVLRADMLDVLIVDEPNAHAVLEQATPAELAAARRHRRGDPERG